MLLARGQTVIEVAQVLVVGQLQVLMRVLLMVEGVGKVLLTGYQSY